MENIFNLCNLRLIDLMQNINSLNKSIKRQEKNGQRISVEERPKSQ